MARPKNVRVEYTIGVTIPTGGFSNIKPEYRVSADVPEGDHPDQTRASLKALADAWLEQDIAEHKAEAGS